MSISVHEVAFNGFEALRDGMQDAPNEIVQLQPGPMSGTITHLSVGTLGVSMGSFTRGMLARGVLSERRWILGARLFGDPVLYQDVDVAPGDLILVKPNHEVYSRYSGVNGYAAAFIEPGELFGYLESQQPGTADAAIWQQSAAVLAVDPRTAADKTQALQNLLTTVAAEGPTMSADVADFYKRNILELFTAPVFDHVEVRNTRLHVSAATLVRDVDRYLIAAANRPVHISELTERFKVHRRTLHRAFNEVLGMPPITFMRRKRLGEVHTALQTGGRNVKIRDVAIAHGFVELGRFSAAYRHLFGELPKETQRRGIRTGFALGRLDPAAEMTYRADG